MDLPKQVKLVEVSPRDGLQNEPHRLPVNVRVALIKRLADCGFQSIEAGSFVSPDWVPQMADSDQVLQGVGQDTRVRYSVLVPNVQGLEAAIAAGAQEVAIFAAASETFSQKNINCSIAESFERFSAVVALAQANQIPVRGYISCCLGCPYEGEVRSKQVALVAKALYGLGCYEISLGDTIGLGTPLQAQQMVHAVLTEVPVKSLAAHFHDTYGQALANLLAVMQLGLHVIDCSVAGLGGCPYAKGASGNVASEDVLYMLNGLDIETGVDLEKLLAVDDFICEALGHVTRSKVALAMGR